MSSLALTLSDRLEALGCPYTEDLDDDAVTDLLLTPGKGRLDILQWLMSSYHPSLSDLLYSGNEATGKKTDARIQKLMTAANAMLLCSRDDASLIQGEGPSSKQEAFLTKLLDLCSKSQHLATHENYQPSPTAFTDSIARSGFVGLLSSNWKPDLVPKDIRAELSKRDDWENAKLPSLRTLMEKSDKLSEDLQTQMKQLENLQKKVKVHSDDQRSEVTTMTQMLTTLVRELGQLMLGFSHIFEARLGLWCQRPPPQLSELGPTLGRVHDNLGDFIKLFEDVSTIRTLQTKLHKSQPKQEIKQDPEKSPLRASEKFHKSLSVLEESLHRNEANFVSKYSVLLAER